MNKRQHKKHKRKLLAQERGVKVHGATTPGRSASVSPERTSPEQLAALIMGSDGEGGRLGCLRGFTIDQDVARRVREWTLRMIKEAEKGPVY